MRSLLTNVPLRSLPYALDHYRQVLDETLSFGDRFMGKPSPYRLLKMVIRQYQAARARIQALRSFEDVIAHLNANWADFHIVPINVINEEDLSGNHRPTSIVLREVRAGNIDTRVKMATSGFLEESVVGEGWEITLGIYTQGTKYKPAITTMGLRSLGIYVTSTEWERDDKNQMYYKFHASMLVRDFKLTDEKDPRWFRDPLLSMYDEEEDDDDGLTPGERRAREAEDGWLDDEIRGLDTYEDFSR